MISWLRKRLRCGAAERHSSIRIPSKAGVTLRRQHRFERVIVEIDMKVGQHRPARLHPLDPFQRLSDREMRAVALMAQRVDDPQVEPLQIVQALVAGCA